MSRGVLPAAQLLVERPDGLKLIQPLARREDALRFVEKLAPLVPLDATWRVADGDEEL